MCARAFNCQAAHISFSVIVYKRDNYLQQPYMMLFSIFVHVVCFLTGKNTEPADCYRDTTRHLCDWFYDRPSTSAQADQYATTSPQPALSAERRFRGSDNATTPNTLYPHSDQFWNDHYKQLKSGSSQTNTTFLFYNTSPTCPVSRPVLLPGSHVWCRGMITPFQTAMTKLYAAPCADVNVPSDEGSSVDPCYTPQYETVDVAGSVRDSHTHWSSVNDCSGLD